MENKHRPVVACQAHIKSAGLYYFYFSATQRNALYLQNFLVGAHRNPGCIRVLIGKINRRNVNFKTYLLGNRQCILNPGIECIKAH
ncbi:hypothetical protein D3C78_1062240 [compost metagenome]